MGRNHPREGHRRPLPARNTGNRQVQRQIKRDSARPTGKGQHTSASGLLAIVSAVRDSGGMASLNVGNLGEYLREQRRSAQLSLRQLADAAGVSNPYLSQIERGLRKPSAEVLQ